MLVDRRVEPPELVVDCRPVLGLDPLSEILEQRPKPPDHLDGRAAVLADLGERELHDVVPAARPDDQRGGRRQRTVHVGRGPSGCAEQPKGLAQMVEDLHGGRRIVDGRRQRPDRDVDHDADREGRILLDRALDA